MPYSLSKEFHWDIKISALVAMKGNLENRLRDTEGVTSGLVKSQVQKAGEKSEATDGAGRQAVFSNPSPHVVGTSLHQ